MGWLVLFSVLAFYASSFAAGNPDRWTREQLISVDAVESADRSIPYSSDILSLYYDFSSDSLFFRVSFVSLRTIEREPRENLWKRDKITLSIEMVSEYGRTCSIHIENDGKFSVECRGKQISGRAVITPEYDMVELGMVNPFSLEEAPSLRFLVKSFADGRLSDEARGDSRHRAKGNAHCALVHHGNQALSYTDVFRGRSDDINGSGFDETLEAHDARNIPVCLHISGPLQVAASWYDPDFNDWVARGVSEGWIDMLGSAYAQHIMPFVNDNMNDWAVYTHRQMTHFYYNFWSSVAWVPERTFLDGPGGRYPNTGVADWLGDNFTDNGISAVILDDDVHCSGYDNHQIHLISGTGLRLVPRDSYFTGRLHAGDGAGALSVLQGLADSPDGNYRIVVYADDWEMAAEMGEWATTMPNAKETYDWFVGKCYEESSWLHTWRISDAIGNPDFNGVSITFTPGSHPSIGGTDGYGGGDNGWYTHWAGTASPSDNHTPQWDYGYIWSDANSNLCSSPDNNISQAGWYVLMTNLYETGWHDGLVGPIAGWEVRFSSHIKNANVYAEGARWAGGEYAESVGAFFADCDHDGNDELVIHNDRVFAVFESIGGRAEWIFAKHSDSCAVIVGNDDAYWEGTDMDYNDANHIAALSDVGVGGVDYEHTYYDWEIAASCSDSAVIVLRHGELRKRVSVYPHQPYLHCEYFTRDKETYIKTGFTPGFISLHWGPDVQRLWRAGRYAGFRNRNTSAVGAYILGSGGASHSTEFSSTLLKGDEIKGKGTFGFYLYAGWASADTFGFSSLLDGISLSLVDRFPPDAYKASYNPGTDILVIWFTEDIDISNVSLSGIGFDEDADGTVDLWLDGSCSVLNTGNESGVRVQLSPAKAASLEVLSREHLVLVFSSGAVRDTHGNLCRPLTAGADEVQVSFTANLSITIDGYLDTLEWHCYSLVIDDPNTDSEWDTAKNEIWGVYLYWDTEYIYFAINGKHEVSPYHNSWLLFLDTDFGGADGFSDLRNIDHWDRNARFLTGCGFKCDYLYGSYRGQTGDFWRILTSTTSEQVIDDLYCETDLASSNPSSEIAVSWDELYHLGAGIVPAYAEIALFASIASPIELGGDCAPNNITAVLPNIDSVWSITVDTNGDGFPEPFEEAVGIASKKLSPTLFELYVYPSPFNSSCNISLTAERSCGNAVVSVYNILGERIDTLYSGRLPAGGHRLLWDARSFSSGIYFVRFSTDGFSQTRKVVLIR